MDEIEPLPHPARFLILRGGAIGDFLVTLPVLETLRRRWPRSHIELLGYPHVAELARLAGLADVVRSLDEAGVARLFSLRPEFTPEQLRYFRAFDLILSFLHDPGETVRENLLAAGARQVICGSPLVTDGHAVDHLLQPLAEMALYVSGLTPRLPWSAERRRAGAMWLAGQGLTAPVLAVHPGSGSPRKNWPAARFAEILRAVREERIFQPLLIIGEADAGAASELVRAADGVPVLAGRPLPEVSDVLSACAAYLGNDSGISHLAAALGLPIVALFGPSDVEHWAPRGPGVRVLRAPGGALDRLETATVLAAVRELRPACAGW